MTIDSILNEYKRQIRELVPSDAGITNIEFEGPKIAIYSRNPGTLVNDEEIIKSLAYKLKKRIVIRSDPAIRRDPESVKEYIYKLVGDEISISDISFDPVLGEVIIEADKPGAIIGRGANRLREIVSETFWRPRVIRTPPLQSRVVNSIRHILQTETTFRRENLQRIGRRIHRPRTIIDDDLIRLTAIGGYREVGRTSNLLQTSESSILIDCGVNVGATTPNKALPRFDLPEFDLDDLDAVIVTHAHLDHSGFIPYLYKYGYRGPVYTTPPTRDLMTMLQIDYLDIAEKEGKLLPYSQSDIKTASLHTITLNYGEVTDIAPDIRLTFHNAGHIIGSSIVHLHIGDGKYNIAFAHDFKYAKTRLLDKAVTKFPRLEAIVMESTYGNPRDVLPSRQESEARLQHLITETINNGGKVLIPVLAVGRAQEIMIILESMIRNKLIPEVPIYTEGMISEATAITTCHPEFLGRSLRERIFHVGSNPFLAEYFHHVTSRDERQEIIEGEPAIIMATSGMLTGGPSVQYFYGLAEEPKNAVIMVSYQGAGTLGARLLDGVRQIPFPTGSGRTRTMEVKARIEQISGFTGHSDRKELMEFAKHLSPRPKKYIIVHGEESKAQNLASSIHKVTKRETLVPYIGSTTILQ